MKLLFGLSLFVVGCTAESSTEPKENRLAHATNDLAFDLLRSYKNEKNVFISPFSISTALGLVYLGADGTTAKAMRSVLKYDKYNLNEPDVHEGFHSLLNRVKQNSDDYQLSAVNNVLVQQDFVIREIYSRALNLYYSAQIGSADFANQEEDVKEKINRYVANVTHGKIQDFLDQPLSRDTKLFLLNAVYFLGNWKDPFSHYVTSKRPFYNNGVETTMVDTMIRSGYYKCSVKNILNATVVVLPYKGKTASMVIVLPHEKTGLTELEQKVTQKTMDEALTTTELLRISIKLPKFKLEYSIELSDGLASLGLEELFSDDANLSLMAGGKTKLKVSSVRHKAVIEVNEKGSEAAAATGIEIKNRARVITSHDVVVDHPFLFFIREDHSGMILFSGRVNEL